MGLLSGLALADDNISVFGVSATGEVLRYFWRPDTWRFENLTRVAADCTPSGPATTTRVSVASDGTQAVAQYGGLYHPALSADGRYVAFRSWAPNLVPDDSNAADDIFVRGPLTPCAQPGP